MLRDGVSTYSIGSNAHRVVPTSTTRGLVALTTALVLLSPAAANATPACPPGTGPPDYLAWYFLTPFVFGAAIGVGLVVTARRGEAARAANIIGGIAVAGAGVVIGAVGFLSQLFRCVPK